MSKGLIAFIAVAAIALTIFLMKESADIARKKSDDILEQFKTVDRSLQKPNESLDSLNKIDFDSLIKANK
jgi:hypothetical protein